MESEDIKNLIYTIVLLVIFGSMFFESVNKHKAGKIKLLSKDHFMAYLDAAVLSYFILIKNISLYALILYFAVEAVVYVIIASVMKEQLHTQLEKFFKNNAWAVTLFEFRNIGIALVIFLFLGWINIDPDNSFSIAEESKLPLVYLAISTFLNYLITKNKPILVIQNMVVAASNLLPIIVIVIILFTVKGAAAYTVYIGMFFIITQTLINVAAVQTICKYYLSDNDKDSGDTKRK